MKNMISYIKQIMQIFAQQSSPSGFEENAVKIFKKEVECYVDEVHFDDQNNCIAHKRGTGKRIVIMAHADEIGLMITYIDNQGFLFFQEIGAIDTNILPGQVVEILGINGDKVIGVIGKKPIHLQERDQCTKQLSSEDLWIDIGAKDKADALSKVEIGTCATFKRNFYSLADNVISSSGADDKIGLAILVCLAKQMRNRKCRDDIYYIASSQEELGSRGAKSIVDQIKPDVGIAVDVTHATDYPTMCFAKFGEICLNKGAVLATGPNINKKVKNALMECAVQNDISFQIEPISHPTGTDANVMQTAICGVKTALISVPCRYMHTPREVISLKDAECVVKILEKYLSDWD